MTIHPLSGLAAVPVSLIDANPDNVRGSLGDLKELADSIREVGILQPLTVEKKLASERYQLLAGHRRLQAAKQAGLRHVPCVLRRDQTPDESLVLMLIENVQRRNLDPIDRAHAFQKLVRMTGSQSEAARRIGVSQTTISQSILLLDLTAGEQDSLRDNDLTITEAKQIVHVRRGSKTHFTGWHLGKAHPLAAQVRLMCKHSQDRKVGSVGCGRCWEEAIRADERRRLADHDLEDLAYPSDPQEKTA